MWLVRNGYIPTNDSINMQASHILFLDQAVAAQIHSIHANYLEAMLNIYINSVKIITMELCCLENICEHTIG